MMISMNFGVLWSDGVDTGASNWFHMGTGEALPMVMVMILVCSGPVVGIQERDGPYCP